MTIGVSLDNKKQSNKPGTGAYCKDNPIKCAEFLKKIEEGSPFSDSSAFESAYIDTFQISNKMLIGTIRTRLQSLLEYLKGKKYIQKNGRFHHTASITEEGRQFIKEHLEGSLR